MNTNSITLETLKNLLTNYVENNHKAEKEFHKTNLDMNRINELNKAAVISMATYSKAKTEYEKAHNVKVHFNPTTCDHFAF